MKSKIQNSKIFMKGISIVIIFTLIFSWLSIFKITLADDDINSSIDDTSVELTDDENVPDENTVLITDDNQLSEENISNRGYDEILSTIKELKAFTEDEYKQFIGDLQSQKNNIDIDDEIKLRLLAAYVAEGNTCSNKTFNITKDIVITSSIEWDPIGDVQVPFAGKLYGNGHVIAGMTLTKKISYAGLFGKINGGLVKDLKMRYANIQMAPNTSGLLNDIISEGAVSYSCLGSIAGCVENGTISNCINSNDIIGGNYVGGIVGFINNSSLTNCRNEGKIRGYVSVGGIAGSFRGTDLSSNKYTMTNCLNKGEIEAVRGNAGGIVGQLYKNAQITKSKNDGNIRIQHSKYKVNFRGEEKTLISQNAGGIAGWVSGDDESKAAKIITEVKYCRNEAFSSVTGYQDIGGIVGQLGGNTGGYARALGCINEADGIKATISNNPQYYVGQIAGCLGTSAQNYRSSVIYNCYFVTKETNQYYGTGNVATVLQHTTKRRSYYDTDLEKVIVLAYGTWYNVNNPNEVLKSYYSVPYAWDEYLYIHYPGFEYEKNSSGEYVLKKNNGEYVRKIYSSVTACTDDATKVGTRNNYGETYIYQKELAALAKNFDVDIHQLVSPDLKPPYSYKSLNINNKSGNKVLKKGDILIITAEFEEKINYKVSKPKMQFKLGDATCIAQLDKIVDNKAVFTYTITGKEQVGNSGIIRITEANLIGKLYDTFDLESTFDSNNNQGSAVTNNFSDYQFLTDNNNKLEFTQTYNPGSNNEYTITYMFSGGTSKEGNIYLKKNDVLSVEVMIDKGILNYSNIRDNIKLNLGENNSSNVVKINPSRDPSNSNTKTIMYYDYTVKEDDEFTVKNAYLSTDGTVSLTKNENTHFNVGKFSNSNTKVDVSSIILDGVEPDFDINISPKEIYGLGEKIIIKATSTEELDTEYSTDNVPELDLKFGGIESKGKAKCINVEKDENGKTVIIYEYEILNTDNGELSIGFSNGSQIRDIAGNVNNLNTKTYNIANSKYADNTLPTVKIAAEDVNNNITNKDTLTYKFTWSEEVTGFTAEDITVNNGIKGALSDVTANTDGTYSYTMNITTNVESGNTGDIQVIVEQDAVKDKVGFGNVRTESVIRVDKQAPILISLEAYADSNINVTEVDSVKQNYKAGDNVTVVATFSENIETSSVVPTLSLQFSESGNAKENVSNGIIEGNKITYTYTIANDDNGTLSVKGFTGKVKDSAGNETVVTKRALDGDTIIADNTNPTLVSLTAIVPEFEYEDVLEENDVVRYGEQSKTRENNTITIIAEYSEDIYNLSSNNISSITNTNAPILKLKFRNSNERTAVFQKVEGNKIYYTYDIGLGDNMDNGELEVTSLRGTVSDLAGNTYNAENTTLPTLVKYEAEVKDENKVNEIIADTTKPSYTITATAVDKDDNENDITGNIKNNVGRYRKGSIITLTARTNEYIYKNNNKELSKFTKENAPTLTVKFGDIVGRGQVNCTNAEYRDNKTIFTYEYVIKENDNGILETSIAENTGYDIALNGNNVKTQTISNIIADTVNPVTNWQSWVESEGYGIVDNGNGTWEVTFSEKLYQYNQDNHVVGSDVTSSTAPILLVSKDNVTPLETTVQNVSHITIDGITKTVITYTYNPYTRNMGAYGMKFASVSDQAGNIFNFRDTTAPVLRKIEVTNPESGTYKAGTEITIVATYSEKIYGNIPTLKVVFGDGESRTITNGTIDGNTITYSYTIQNGDNGKLSIVSIEGTGLTDLSDNEWQVPETAPTLSGNSIIADTIAPTVVITSDVERTNTDVVTYTFTWSEPVKDFTIEDIEVTNGSKGELTKVNDSTYKLTVDSTNEGRQIVKVNSGVCTDFALVDGNANEERATYNKVVIDYTKPVIRAKVNGGKFVIDTDSQKSTLSETIVVNEELSNFEYAWSTQTDIDNITNWQTEDVNNILVNSDINLSKKVSEEGTYYLYIKATDLAGNTLRARTNAFIVSDSKITFAGIPVQATNEDITVTVTYGEGLTENRKAGISGKTQSADSTKIIIGENGTVYAEATDKVGNKVYATQEITNIDKEPPTANITYTENPDKTITATITLSDGTITNNDGNNTYTFDENGEFTFEFEDELGNKGTAVAKVTSIKVGIIEPVVDQDTTAPTLTYNYTSTSANVGTQIGATLTTDEDAIISYSWDNQNWTNSQTYVRNANAVKTPTTAGTYTLYAKATDKAGNQSAVQELNFTIVASGEEIIAPEIIFEDLVTLQVNGVKYVKVSPTMTTQDVTAKMNSIALRGATPVYTNLTSTNTLKTGSEITINGETKYVIIVNGDVNCDGKVTFLGDVVMANNYRIGQIQLNILQQLAADINNSRTVDFIPDIVAINNYRLGRITTL